MTRTIRFTQAQIRRAVKAVEATGLKVRAVRVYPDGSIEIETGEPSKHAAATALVGWEDI
jgi:hypothetical protein